MSRRRPRRRRRSSPSGSCAVVGGAGTVVVVATVVVVVVVVVVSWTWLFVDVVGVVVVVVVVVGTELGGARRSEVAGIDERHARAQSTTTTTRPIHRRFATQTRAAAPFIAGTLPCRDGTAGRLRRGCGPTRGPGLCHRVRAPESHTLTQTPVRTRLRRVRGQPAGGPVGGGSGLPPPAGGITARRPSLRSRSPGASALVGVTPS